MEKLVTTTEKETWQEGFNFAKKLKGGEILALTGDLGAGKTKFLQGLAKGLGVKGRVNSPTFNILKIYPVSNNKKIKNFCHIDAYRLEGAKNLLDLGIEEYFQDKKTVTAIEWAEKVKSLFSKNTIKIKIKQTASEKRTILIYKNNNI